MSTILQQKEKQKNALKKTRPWYDPVSSLTPPAAPRPCAHCPTVVNLNIPVMVPPPSLYFAFLSAWNSFLPDVYLACLFTSFDFAQVSFSQWDSLHYCCGLIMSPRKIYWRPNFLYLWMWTLFANRVFADIIKLYWIRVGPKSSDCCPYFKKRKWRHNTHTGKKAMWQWGQRLDKPRKTDSCWQPLEARRGKEGFSPRVVRGNMPPLTPNFVFLISRSMRT